MPIGVKSSWRKSDGRKHHVEDIIVENEGSGKDALAACFTDDRGQEYFTRISQMKTTIRV